MESKIDLKLVLSIVMLISFGLILTFGYVIYDEISSAKKECENIGEVYEIKDFNHLCNNQTFYKYSDGTWNFDTTYSWKNIT